MDVCNIIVQLARRLGVMDDEKAGVPRTAYLGVVPLRLRGGGGGGGPGPLLYLAPAGGGQGYAN